MSVEANVVSMTAAPGVLANEAASFFYSVFLLSEVQRRSLIEDLTTMFESEGLLYDVSYANQSIGRCALIPST